MSKKQVEELRRVVQRVFRSFGTLGGNSTPCGQALSIAHAHALMWLLAEGEQTQQQLAQELRIDKSNVARLCAKMVTAGHAVQAPCPLDRRSRRVSLSAAGVKLAQSVDESSRKRFEALLQQLPRENRNSLVAHLKLLVSAADKITHSHSNKELTQ